MTDDPDYGPFELGLRLGATERELAEMRRQRDLLLEAALESDALTREVSPEEAEELAAKWDSWRAVLAIRRAIRECEPPKPTREELESEIVERAAKYARWRLDKHAWSGGKDLLDGMCEAVYELDALEGKE